MQPHPLPRLSARALAAKASDIRELLKLVTRPSVISFAGGIPDPAMFNVALFQEAYRQTFAGPSIAREALQYSATEGYLPLRQWIVGRMEQAGIACGPDNILITGGSQQGLDLIGKLMLDAGDSVATAQPTYLGALQAFSAYQPRFEAFDGRAEGACPPKLIYLVPDFANPTGETMSLAARQAVLAQADSDGALIVEDAAYSALRFDGDDVPAIAALDQARSGGIEGTRTLYCGSFSKTLAPGLRVGWICGPAALIRRLVLLKQGADLHTATINQIIIHHAAVASFDTQVTRIRSAYRLRRDAMLAALHRHAPDGVQWSQPQGGMFVWVTMPEHIDAAVLLKQALRADIAFVPGAPFFSDGSGRNTMRLSFSLCDEAQIEIGIYKLCGLIGQMARRAELVV
ncbi:MAG TPA: PLP-dependent aminotransferase family protein [Devosia sp.]|nr:PLP-dependent aminotransferase family protein [Devosia sp.]